MITNPLVEQGLQQGRIAEKKAIATSMLRKGFSLPVIAEITELKPIDIEAIRSAQINEQQQKSQSC